MARARSLYLAEAPEHALAEKLQRFRGQRVDAADLLERGRSLALAPVMLRPSLREKIADLCDPAVLLEHEIRPDQLQAVDRTCTQDIARNLHEKGIPGLRWWSTLRGEWHNVTLWIETGDADSLAKEEDISFGAPERVTLTSPHLRKAAAALRVEVLQWEHP